MQCIPLMKVNTIVQGNHGNSGYVVLQASESQNNLAMIKTSGHWIEVFNFSAISHWILRGLHTINALDSFLSEP